MAGKKYDGPKRGILDLLDIIVGRVSDSDSSQPGKRKRSWGATVMFFCMIPAFTLVFAVAFQVVYSSVRTPAVVSDQGKTTTGSTGKKTKTHKVSIASPPNYIGWPIVALAGGILLLGAAFALIRREQDLTRALQIGGMVAEVKNGTSGLSSSTHSVLEETLQSAISKVTGVETKNGKSDAAKPSETAPADPSEIPIEPISEEWAERQKQK